MIMVITNNRRGTMLIEDTYLTFCTVHVIFEIYTNIVNIGFRPDIDAVINTNRAAIVIYSVYYVSFF